jgi:hypothetical protein
MLPPLPLCITKGGKLCIPELLLVPYIPATSLPEVELALQPGIVVGGGIGKYSEVLLTVRGETALGGPLPGPPL